MKSILIIICLVGVILYFIKKNKVIRKNLITEKEANVDFANKLNPLLKEYIELTSNLKKTIYSSSEILNVGSFSLEDNVIKEQIKLAFQSGKLDEIMDDFIHDNFDSIDYIINNLLEVAKSVSKLNKMQLEIVDTKMPYILSDLQKQITDRLETISLLEEVDVAEIKQFLIDLVVNSKTQMIKYYFEHK